MSEAMILYAGSSRGIADPAKEIPFVRRWLEGLRRTAPQSIRSAPVLVRPHLSNVQAWAGVDLSDLGPVSIWPRERPGLPMNELETSDYFHSLFHSAAVVGINTSAMIEATILDRPVLTVEVPEFADTQTGTTHFRYLVPSGGGSVSTASTLDEHYGQLARAVSEPGSGADERARFVERFVRPRGTDRPALGFVLEALEELPHLRHRAQIDGAALLAPLRWGLRFMTRASHGPAR
jgi:hypothetical protein